MSSSVVVEMFPDEGDDFSDQFSPINFPFFYPGEVVSHESIFDEFCMTDVSESSSEDDRIRKLSQDLELPLSMDVLDVMPSWHCNQLQTTHAMQSEDDLSADEFTRALNFVRGGSASGSSVWQDDLELIPKEEPESPKAYHLPPTPETSEDVWEVLWSPETKSTNLHLRETPPLTPPQSSCSPPHSPPPILPSTTSQRRQISSTGSAETVRVVTISTRSGSLNDQRLNCVRDGRVSKTTKIQPKILPGAACTPQIISIFNSSTQKRDNSNSSSRVTLPNGTRVLTVKPVSPLPQLASTAITPITTSIRTTASSNLSSSATSSSAAHLTLLAPALLPSNKPDSTSESRVFKRQQRMIKNRESASLSRKKKKEYVTTLEGNINALVGENNSLREENNRLQQKVATLEAEVKSLRFSMNRSPNRKTTTVLFAFLFLVSLNLGPLTSILLRSESRLAPLDGSIGGVGESGLPRAVGGFSHRSLLWGQLESDGALDGEGTPLNGSAHMCPMFINATESLRLESELQGLFHHKQTAAKVALQKLPKWRNQIEVKRNGADNAAYKANAIQRSADAMSDSALNWPQMAPKVYRYLVPDVLQEVQATPEGTTGMIPSVPQLASLLDAIERRNDTYYVVSFSPDHLLIPAAARNDSARPRMALLLPTLSRGAANESVSGGRFTLMQIDCEVMNTRLIRVRGEALPPHMKGAQAGAGVGGRGSRNASETRGERRRRGRLGV